MTGAKDKAATDQHDADRLRRIEVAAILGARADHREDKTDWIRVWTIARQGRGLSADGEAWRDTYYGARNDN